MMQPLDGMEAYAAGATDAAKARRRVKHSLKNKLLAPNQADALFQKELSALLQERIDRGEFMTPMRKAS